MARHLCESHGAGWRHPGAAVSPLTTPVAGHWVGTNQAAWMAVARNAGTAIGIDTAGMRRRAAYETAEPWTEPGLEGRWLLTPPLLAPDAADDEAAQGTLLLTVAADGGVSREVFCGTTRRHLRSAARPARLRLCVSEQD